jgi:putative ABC transport system permease protein
MNMLFLRLRSLFRKAAVDRDLDNETRHHLEMQIEELVRRGVPEHQAAIAARRQFGNVTLHKEECRDTRNLAWFENLLQDFRHGFRTLRRSRGFTAIAILTLALGIGATTALFSVLDAALLHPLTAYQPDRLIWLQEFSAEHNESGGNPPRLADWQKAHSFMAVGGFYSESAMWASADGPLQLIVLRTLGDLGSALQVKTQLGRSFTPGEERGEGQPIALLTDRAFRQRFHSNPNILNQTIRVSGAAYQVIGILNSELDYPEDVDLWTPAPPGLEKTSRAAGFLDVVARLRPDISQNQAQAEINVLITRLAEQYPATDHGRSARIIPLASHISETVRKPLLLLFGAVAGVLLIGCLNIAGLLLARGLARRREAAIRVSVGAGYGRLVRLFFAESLIIAGAGCIFGLLLALLGVDLLKLVLPADVPHLAAVSLNVPVALCGVLLSLLAAVVFGGLPAWQFAAGAQNAALKDGSAASVGAKRSRLRNALVIAEVAFSMVLLVVAALLANSFLKMRSRPAGFNAAQAYSFALNLPWDSDPRAINSASAETLNRLDAFPGAIAHGAVDRLPLHGGSQTRYLLVRGKTLPPRLAEKEFGFRTASAGFFPASGIPLVAGALYRDWQAGKGTREAVISQRLADALFPGEDPIGHEIADSPRGNGALPEPKWFRIVGVIGSVASHPADAEPAAELYVPWGATYWPMMNFVVRTNRPVADVSRYLHDQIQTAMAGQIFSPVASLEQRTAETRTAPRTAASLVGGFALAALMLSALGIFGLMAHETTRRTQEIGVRLALGAESSSIAFDSIMRGVKLAAVGLALGLGGAWFASRLLENLLFGVAPHDAPSYAIAAVVLLAAATLASLFPALRAARIDPIQALRHE